jgi:hypothetical protein
VGSKINLQSSIISTLFAKLILKEFHWQNTLIYSTEKSDFTEEQSECHCFKVIMNFRMIIFVEYKITVTNIWNSDLTFSLTGRKITKNNSMECSILKDKIQIFVEN